LSFFWSVDVDAGADTDASGEGEGPGTAAGDNASDVHMRVRDMFDDY
jgi:hypothetical protein